MFLHNKNEKRICAAAHNDSRLAFVPHHNSFCHNRLNLQRPQRLWTCICVHDSAHVCDDAKPTVMRTRTYAHTRMIFLDERKLGVACASALVVSCYAATMHRILCWRVTGVHNDALNYQSLHSREIFFHHKRHMDVQSPSISTCDLWRWKLTSF